MSLNARDRQALSRIEEGLASSDPRFAARLSAFSRLADAEGTPPRERIRSLRQRIGPVATPRWWLRWTGGAWILWLAISMALFAVAVVLSQTTAAPKCAQWQGFTCVQRAQPSAPPSSGGPGGGAPSRGPGAG